MILERRGYQYGGALIELSIIAPVIILLALLTFEYARHYQIKNQVINLTGELSKAYFNHCMKQAGPKGYPDFSPDNAVNAVGNPSNTGSYLLNCMVNYGAAARNLTNAVFGSTNTNYFFLISYYQVLPQVNSSVNSFPNRIAMLGCVKITNSGVVFCPMDSALSPLESSIKKTEGVFAQWIVEGPTRAAVIEGFYNYNNERVFFRNTGFLNLNSVIPRLGPPSWIKYVSII